jgi:seryl-tRNA synthetase
MPDEITPVDDTHEEVPKKTEPANVPYARFKEVIDQKNALAARISDLEKGAAEKAESEKSELMKLQERAEKLSVELAAAQKQTTEQAALLEKYQAALTTVVDESITDWPEELKMLGPSGNDVLERLAWSQKSKAIAEKLKSPAQAAPGTAPKPTPKVDSSKAVEVDVGVRRTF